MIYAVLEQHRFIFQLQHLQSIGLRPFARNAARLGPAGYALFHFSHDALMHALPIFA